MNSRNDLVGEGERRQATILFADLSGFTSLSEKIDAEELTGIVNECLKIMGNCVEENEGTIDKYIGDCIMAVFGVPVSIEDAPVKAINTAIEIKNKINQYNQTLKFKYPLDIHIGINTGMVVAGPVGTDDKMENTVMGDAVNIASRLKDISAAGQIYAGQTTYRYTKDYFQYRKIGPVKVKGKGEALVVYELLSSREKMGRQVWRSNRMIHSAMVGRQSELDKLSLHLLKLVNGEGSIVNVMGEAGIGKSRLMAELREKDEIGRITFLEGRAISAGKNLSFHPIIDMLKKWCDVREEDTEKAVNLKLEKKISSVTGEESTELYPFLATLMGLKLTGKYAERIKGIEGMALEKLILRSLDTLFVKMTSTKPLMIVIEDLHWSDLTSIEMLESLYRHAENHPILFINVFRPGYKETSERILKTIETRYPGNYVTIKLESLSENNCESLISNLLRIKGFPVEIKDQIVKRTSGNPFFIEEIIRSFIDDGTILIRNKKFEVTHKIDSVVIPESINEVIMSRIDRLDESARSLLKLASVIGRSFYYKILKNMAEVNKDINDQLALIEEMQLISKQQNTEELAYLFKHALAQEATYESILLKKRKELHLKTAETIERIFADKISEFYGILAWHYSKGEDFKKSEEFLMKAGEEALRTSASSEAINYFQDGLKIYRTYYGDKVDPKKIADMELNIGTALLNKGQFGEAVKYFDSVLEYYGVKTNASDIGTILTVISGFLHLLAALYIPSLKWKKIPTPEDVKLNRLLFKHLHCFGFVENERMAFSSFQFLKRLTNFDLSRAEYGVDQFVMASYIFSYGGISFKLSRKIFSFMKDKLNPDDITEKMSYTTFRCLHDRMEGNHRSHFYDSNLVEESFKIGNLQITSYYIIFSFFIELEQGKFKEAWQKIEKLQEMRELFDNYTVEGWVFLAKSKLLTKQRKFQEAFHQMEKFIEFCRKVDDKTQLLWGYSSKAYIQLLMEDVSGAEKTLQHIPMEKSLDMILVFKTTLMVTQLGIQIFNFEKKIKNNGSIRIDLSKKAHKLCKEAVRVARKIADDRVEILKLVGTYYWLIGKQKKAIKWWDRSIKSGLKIDALPELSRTYLEIGRRLKEPGSRYQHISGINADGYFAKAGKLFEELDFEWDMKVLENLNTL